MTKRVVGVTVVCLCAAAIVNVFAQEQARPVFRAGVELVTVPVIVVDRDGKPAVGLTADDFEVRLAGRTTPIRSVTFVRASAPADAGAPPAPRDRETSNVGGDRRASNGEIQPRVLVVLIDDLSFRPTNGELMAMRVAVTRMVSQLGPADLAGLATTSGRVAVNPTTDRSSLGAALRGVAGQFDEFNRTPFVTIDEGEAITREGTVDGPVTTLVATRECGKDVVRMLLCVEAVQASARSVVSEASARAATQVRSIVGIGRAMGRAPGRKTLVVVSAGLAVGERLGAGALSAVGEAVAEAGVDLYAVTGAPEDFQMSERNPARATARGKEARWLQSGINHLAGAAAAPHFRVVGQPDPFFDRVLNETSGHYVLGVDAPPATSGRAPIASVAVKRAGFTIRTHKHAIVRSVTPEVLSTEQQLRRALLEGTPSFDVPVTVAASSRRASNGSQIELGVNLSVPGHIPAPLTVGFAVVEQGGRVQRSGSVNVSSAGAEPEHRTSFAVEVSAGEFRLRVAVIDGVGAVGTVELPVRARLTPVGRFFVSDLQTFFVDDQGRQKFLALERVPEQATYVGAALELYGAGIENETPPTIRLDVIPIGTNVAAATQSIQAIATGRLLRADTRVKLEGLSPGTYSLRATVLENGAAVGTVSTTMKKMVGDVDAAAAKPMTPTFAPPPVSAATPNVGPRPSSDAVRAALQQEASAKRPFDPAPMLAVADRHAAAIKAESAEAAATFSQGVARLRVADPRGAQTSFETASSGGSGSLSALLFMGVAHAQAGRDREAVGAWQMGLMQEGAEDVWVSALIDALIRQNELSESDTVLTEGLKRLPESRLLRRRQVERLLSAGRFADAQPLLKVINATDFNDDPLKFWQIALAFAEALEPGALPAAVASFRSLAEPYVTAGKGRAAIVEGWLTILR